MAKHLVLYIKFSNFRHSIEYEEQNHPIFMQLTDQKIIAEQPIQRLYWPENAIDWPEPV